MTIPLIENVLLTATKEARGVIEEVRQFAIETNWWIAKSEKIVWQMGTAVLLGVLFSTLLSVGGIRYQFQQEATKANI